ncbi:MAG: hypothetical protein ACLSFT_12015 [Ruminococcus callidus]
MTTTQTASGAWAQKDSYRGIDVSKYQGNIDWNAVKAARQRLRHYPCRLRQIRQPEGPLL